MGSFCPGIGNIAGFIIGAGAATIGAIGGEYIGENLYDRVSNLKTVEITMRIILFLKVEIMI